MGISLSASFLLIFFTGQLEIAVGIWIEAVIGEKKKKPNEIRRNT